MGEGESLAFSAANIESIHGDSLLPILLLWLIMDARMRHVLPSFLSMPFLSLAHILQVGGIKWDPEKKTGRL